MEPFTNYMRKVLQTGHIESMPFDPEHYRKVGMTYAPVRGIPALEAYQLVNYWNATEQTAVRDTRFIYWLA